jgi:hypothetical protein
MRARIEDQRNWVVETQELWFGVQKRKEKREDAKNGYGRGFCSRDFDVLFCCRFRPVMFLCVSVFLVLLFVRSV